MNQQWSHIANADSCKVHEYSVHSDELHRQWVPDPFLERVDNTTIFRWYCRNCWNERRDEV